MVKWTKYLSTIFVGSAAGVTVGCVVAAVVLGYSLPESARQSPSATTPSAQDATLDTSTCRADGNDSYKVYLNDLLAKQVESKVSAQNDLSSTIRNAVSPSV